MSMFFNKRKPLLKSERYYEDEPQGFEFNKYLKFSVFVIVALVLVVAIVLSMFAFNYKNNAFVMFNKASSKNFDCGSFSYQISAGMNNETYMAYDGVLEFDLDDRTIESSYHAVYEDYEYDAVTYADGATAYKGNYYGGKWTVENYSERALDFYGFYNDYRKGRFDAGAAVRFTQTNDVFNAYSLKTAVEEILDELTKTSNVNGVLHQQMKTENGETTITFTPELDKVFDIILSYIGPAYTSANAFSEFRDRVQNSSSNLQNADASISYTIDERGYLTYINISYVVENDSYVVEVFMDDFKEAQAEIPESFFTAAGIERAK